MGWLEDALAALQGGGAPAAFQPPASPFPDPPRAAPALDGQALWDQIEAQTRAENAAADRRNVGGMVRQTAPYQPFMAPDQNGAAIQLAMDQAPAGTGVPVPGSPQFQPFGIPPSMAAAKEMTAPPPMAPQAPIAGLNAPIGGAPSAVPPGAPTDVSARARPPAPAGAPMGIPAAVAPTDEPSLMQRIGAGAGAVAPALLGLGAALQGDQGHLTVKMAADREAKAIQTQQMNLTGNALLKAGAPPELVAAAVKNPEMLKAAIGQYFGKDKFSVVQTKEVEDQYGGKRKVFQTFNANDGTFKDIPANSADEARAAAGGEGAIDLTPDQKNRVQAIIDGREPYPAMSRATDAAKIRAAVHATDPAFDAVNYKARQETRTKFTKGKGADNLSAFNTAIGHLGSLDKSIDNLSNSGFPAWNKYVANPIAEQFDPKYQKGLKEFQTARTAVADELTRAFRGSGGNVHDIIQWENAINAADSPVALKAAVRAAAELLNSRVMSIGDEYNRGMGTTKDPLELLNPTAAASFKRMLEGERKAGAPTAATKGTVNIGGVSFPWSVN